MKTIWKYEFEIADRIELAMPNDPKILTAFVQQENVSTDGLPMLAFRHRACLWAEVDPDSIKSIYRFAVVGTGHEVPDDGEWLATFKDGPFIWHLYKL